MNCGRFYSSFTKRKIGSRDGGVRALSSHQCSLCSFLEPSNVSGLSLLVVRFFLAPRVFLQVLCLVFLPPQNIQHSKFHLNLHSWTIYNMFKSSLPCIQGKILQLLSIYICMNLQTKESTKCPYHLFRSSPEIGFSGLLITCLLVPDFTLTWYISLVESINRLYIFFELVRNWYMAFVFPWPNMSW